MSTDSDAVPASASTASATAATLTLAVLTFRRPADITEVLPLLVQQAESIAELLDVEVLVVDNDEHGSARDVVLDHVGSSAVRVRYVVEPAPGISAARNRALDEAVLRDLLVFIDDDERPSPTWLSSLVTTWQRHGCAAVAGPVVSEFAVEPDPWIQAGRFFVRRRMPTGSVLSVAATNNLLLDLRQVREQDLRFDPAFGIGGGEDTLFTRSLSTHGGVMLWCDEAVVTDVVPTSRLSRAWVVRRAFSSGNSWSLTSLVLASTRGRRCRARLSLAGLGLVRVAGGTALLTLGVASRSTSRRARGTRTAARGLGMLAGLWGFSYQEYRREA